MRAIVLTLFPEMFPGPLGCSLAGKALKKGLWSLEALDIRSFAQDKHKTVDDSPYGGGVGMVMKPDVVDAAVEHAKARMPDARIIYTTPRGIPLTQPLVNQLKNLNLIILCGRFEGVDQRVVDHHGMLEVSLGDFVLSGGEIAALALLDACVRLLPGVIGKEEALAEESFSFPLSLEGRGWRAAPGEGDCRRQAFGHPHASDCASGLSSAAPPSRGSKKEEKSFAQASEYAGLLEYPHYTRPSLWKGNAVPDVLLSGNHEEIKAWRLEQAKNITKMRRPDLLTW